MFRIKYEPTWLGNDCYIIQKRYWGFFWKQVGFAFSVPKAAEMIANFKRYS